MQLTKFGIMIILFSLFILTACNDESTDPEEVNLQTEVETSLKEVDAMMGQTTTGPMVYAMLQFQNIAPAMLDLSVIPFTPEQLFTQGLSKKSVSQKFYDVKIDTGMISLFTALEFMRGTHTFEDSIWVYSAEPTNAVVMVYPFVSLEDGLEHNARIVISNQPLTNSSAQLSLELKIDGVTNASINLSLSGNNFLMPETESSLNTVSVSGQLIDGTGLAADYSVNVSDSDVDMTFGVGGLPLLTLNVSGSGFLSGTLSEDDESEPTVTQINITYKGLLKLEIDDPQAESGEVGNVYYEEKLAGKLVVEADELYIVFNNGNKVAISSLMPNAINTVGVFGGIM